MQLKLFLSFKGKYLLKQGPKSMIFHPYNIIFCLLREGIWSNFVNEEDKITICYSFTVSPVNHKPPISAKVAYSARAIQKRLEQRAWERSGTREVVSDCSTGLFSTDRKTAPDSRQVCHNSEEQEKQHCALLTSWTEQMFYVCQKAQIRGTWSHMCDLTSYFARIYKEVGKWHC